MKKNNKVLGRFQIQKSVQITELKLLKLLITEARTKSIMLINVKEFTEKLFQALLTVPPTVTASNHVFSNIFSI